MACWFARREISVNFVLIVGTEIPVGVVTGGIGAPESDVPCIFVGPGTGIAPMRAMIEQRIHNGSKSELISFPH